MESDVSSDYLGPVIFPVCETEGRGCENDGQFAMHTSHRGSAVVKMLSKFCKEYSLSGLCSSRRTTAVLGRNTGTSDVFVRHLAELTPYITIVATASFLSMD